MGWTTITANTSWQELAIAQEIATAYNLRLSVLTATERINMGVSAISPSEAMTVFDFVHTVQLGIESTAKYWSKASADLTGGDDYPESFAFTEDFMTEAGLTEEGYWRRIADSGTQPNNWTVYDASGWSYGLITSRDLAGPWLFIDLQKALSAMTRRIYDVGDYLHANPDDLVVECLEEGDSGVQESSSPSGVPFVEDAEEEDPYSLYPKGSMKVRKGHYKDAADEYYWWSWGAWAWPTSSSASFFSEVEMSGYGTVEKDIYVLGKAGMTCAAVNTGIWSTDLGKTSWDWEASSLTQSNTPVVAFVTVLNDTTGEIDFTVPPQKASEWGSWDDLLAYIVMPDVDDDEYYAERLLAYTTEVDKIAIDYHFNP